MALLQALFLAFSRRVGQLVNTLFGWATQLLFGKVSKDKQLFVSGMALGSLVWLISLIGIAFPAVGTFLLALVPLPHGTPHHWVRLLMLGIVLLLPLLVGGLGLWMLSPEDRPTATVERVKAVLRGYPYTVGLGVTLLLMTLFAPFLKLPLLAKRWTTDHVPLIVEAKDYEDLLARVEASLSDAGWQVTRQPAPWMVRLPTKVLVSTAGTLVERFVAERLTTLRATASARPGEKHVRSHARQVRQERQERSLEVMLHPADLVISGGEHDVARVRALLAERLAFSPAHQTWTKEANGLEDRVTDLWRWLQDGAIEPVAARQELRQIAQERDHLEVDFEEWEVLERQQLLVERSLLDAVLAAAKPAPVDGTDAHEGLLRVVPAEGAAQVSTRGNTGKGRRGARESGRYDWLFGAIAFGALGLLGSLLGRFRPVGKEEPTAS